MTELYFFFYVYRDNLTIDYYIYIFISLISCGTNTVPDHILGGKIWRRRKIRNISIADIYVGDADGGTPKTRCVVTPTQTCVPTLPVGTNGATSGRRKHETQNISDFVRKHCPERRRSVQGIRIRG